MKIIGVDPGATGAIVILENGQPIDWLAMPTIKLASKSRVNGAAIKGFLGAHRGTLTHAFIEKVGAAPTQGRKQGAAGMFSFGHSAGVVEGVIIGEGIPVTLVLPEVWKRRAGLIGCEKEHSRARGVQLFPTWRELDAKAKGQAFSEAALIALHGVRE